MPPKNKPPKIITHIETQEDFNKLVINGNKLAIVDAYPGWCGPVKATDNLFKRITIDNSYDKCLGFFSACIDKTSQLESYKNTIPEPLFLFYSGGILIDRIRGTNAPVIERTILQKLALEHKIQDSEQDENAENIERIPIDVIEGGKYSKAEEPNIDETETVEKPKIEKDTPEKEHTFAIIKPGCFDHMDEIIKKLTENGIDIKKRLEVKLSENQVKQLYNAHVAEDYYDQLCEYMTSGESCLLLLEAPINTDLIIKTREIVGPFDVESAKESNPDSLRAQFGQNKVKNAIHASDSKEAAARELAFFFPELESVESTVAILRPGVIEKYGDEIMASIWDCGFLIADIKKIKLTEQQVGSFYSKQKNEDYFPALLETMTSGTCTVLLLSSINAVSKWRNILGPAVVDDKVKADESNANLMRVKFSSSSDINSMHGSCDKIEADRDVKLFFPNCSDTSFGIVKPDGMENKDDIIASLKENGLDVCFGEEVTLNEDVLKSIYKDQQNKDHFKNLLDHMTSNKSFVFLVSGKNAIKNLRAKIGPVDPEIAKEQNPDTLRAKFGKSILENAIHSATDKNDVNNIFDIVDYGKYMDKVLGIE